jgi:hypothetical protein
LFGFFIKHLSSLMICTSTSLSTIWFCLSCNVYEVQY